MAHTCWGYCHICRPDELPKEPYKGGKTLMQKLLEESIEEALGEVFEGPSEVGEIWYIQLTDKGPLVPHIILDITPKTVKIGEVSKGGKMTIRHSEHRYRRSDLVFVERIE